jgi:hypothetical protein
MKTNNRLKMLENWPANGKLGEFWWRIWPFCFVENKRWVLDLRIINGLWRFVQLSHPFINGQKAK